LSSTLNVLLPKTNIDVYNAIDGGLPHSFLDKQRVISVFAQDLPSIEWLVNRCFELFILES